MQRSRGRQKIEIKPIQKEEARQVCFTKRRQGLFKKASELCVLCGAEVAVVVFSPAGKLFSYGHPSVDDVHRRLLHGAAAGSPGAPPSADCGELHRMVMQLTATLEAERNRRKELASALRAPWPGPKPFWWDADVHEMGAEELCEYETLLLQCREMVAWWAAQFGPFGFDGSMAVGPARSGVGFGGELELNELLFPQPQPISAVAPRQMQAGEYGDSGRRFVYGF
ncbi:hypothetical protein HPP92_024385 [Vanilla planifolia]|uniref:MADS-box domain-containing protein n=1 Tax=Vanilla planifolia TaxID=51239 RepID=A0A835UBF0_VANPL|nr:hypothetical protein HPP92_024385 [Vanilla planifolia]